MHDLKLSYGYQCELMHSCDSTYFCHLRNKLTWIHRRSSRIHPGEEVEGALIRSDKLIKRKLLSHNNNNKSHSSSSSGVKPGLGYPCPSRPKRLRATVSDDDVSPEVTTDENGSHKKFGCLGLTVHKSSRHPRRFLFKEGGGHNNTLELGHMTSSHGHMTCNHGSNSHSNAHARNSHLQRNNFGDYDLVPSDSSTSKQRD